MSEASPAQPPVALASIRSRHARSAMAKKPIPQASPHSSWQGRQLERENGKMGNGGLKEHFFYPFRPVTTDMSEG